MRHREISADTTSMMSIFTGDPNKHKFRVLPPLLSTLEKGQFALLTTKQYTQISFCRNIFICQGDVARGLQPVNLLANNINEINESGIVFYGVIFILPSHYKL